jgi:hypothetical protein
LFVAGTWPWCPGRFPRRLDAAAAGEEELGRCTAEQGKYCRLYLHSGKITLEQWFSGEFGSLAVDLRQRSRMFRGLLCRQRQRHGTSAWASGGVAGGRRVAVCLGRWRALRLRGPPRRVQRPYFRWMAFLNYVLGFEIPIATHHNH